LPHIEALQRCDSTERKVVYILKECKKYDIKLQSSESVEHVVEICQEMAQTRNCSLRNMFDKIEKEVENIATFLKQQE